MKEAQASVLEPFVGESALEHHGLRVVAGQRLTQAASDIFLGWTHGADHGSALLVRQLWNVKGQGDPMQMEVQPPRALRRAVRLGARARPRAHRRLGQDRWLPRSVATPSSGRWCASADAYAATNEADHAALVEAIRDGRDHRGRRGVSLRPSLRAS